MINKDRGCVVVRVTYVDLRIISRVLWLENNPGKGEAEDGTCTRATSRTRERGKRKETEEGGRRRSVYVTGCGELKTKKGRMKTKLNKDYLGTKTAE